MGLAQYFPFEEPLAREGDRFSRFGSEKRDETRNHNKAVILVAQE